MTRARYCEGACYTGKERETESCKMNKQTLARKGGIYVSTSVPDTLGDISLFITWVLLDICTHHILLRC